MRFKCLLSLAFLVFLPVVCWAACTGSSPTWSSTADYASVNSCVRSASAGDTINISAGTETWSSILTINKPIKLIGAGIGSTVITRGGTGIISISNPANKNLTRVSGFTFKTSGGSEGSGIQLSCSDAAGAAKWNIRIDHNLFTTPSGTCSVGHCFIKNKGCRGVIDNCTFEKASYPLGVGLANDEKEAWENNPDLVFGTANDNIYIEDCTFTNVSDAVTDCDEGGRYAFRYNSFSASTDMWPWLDSHGGKGGTYSCMGVEIYGNQFNRPGKQHANQYAARSTAHHNYSTSGGSIQIKDAEGCPVLERERLNNTYYFLNRTGGLAGSLVDVSQSASESCGQSISANYNYWKDNSSCIYPNACSNLTNGIGCGPLANRPTSCTTGTAYWATNQSCTSVSGMVGPNPSTPISGTLYKCTTMNTWTAYYTPYTYPHPLRGETTPVGKSNLRRLP